MKKNKKGFTLIEVIAVIVILGIILMLVSVPASKYIFNSKMKTYKSHQKDLEVATKNYMIDCLANDESNCNLPTSSKSVTIPYNKLVTLGYSDELKDPEGDGYCYKSYVIAEQKGNDGVDIGYKSCLICDNYKTDEEWCKEEEVTCSLEVEGTNQNGNYTSKVDVSLTPIGDNIEEWGIVTDINKLQYNQKNEITIKNKGVTTIYGVVKNANGVEGICSKTINIDFIPPEANIYMGYEIYPKENSTTNNNIITINNLSKYGDVSGVLVEFSSSLTTSSTGDIKSGNNSIKTEGGFLTGRDNAIFKINKETYDSLTIDLGSSSIKDAVSKIRLLKQENETSVYTNKDVMIYVDAIDNGSSVSEYSYDNGINYVNAEKGNMQTFSENTEGIILLKDAFGNVSDPYDYKITTIDKDIPTLNFDYTTAKYDWGYYINNIKFSSDDDIQKIEIVEKTTNVVPTSSDTIIDITEVKERNYSNIKNDQYLFVRLTDRSGNISQWYKYNLFIGAKLYVSEYNYVGFSDLGNGYTKNVYKCGDATCNNLISNNKVNNNYFYVSTKGSGFYKVIINDNDSDVSLSRIMYLHNFDDYEYWEQEASVTISTNMTIEYTVHDDYVYEFLPTIDGKTLNMYINGDYHYDEWCESYYCPEGGTLDGYTCTGEDYDLEGGGNSYTCEFIEDNYYWVEHPGDLACDEGYEKGYDCGADEGPEGSCTAGDTDFTPCSGWCTWQGDYEATCDDPRESYDYYFTAGVVFK